MQIFAYLPLLVSFIWFLFNNRKLSSGLHMLCLIWVFAEWYLGHGKYSPALPIYLLYTTIDLSSDSGISRKWDWMQLLLGLLAILYSAHIAFGGIDKLDIKYGLACAFFPITLFIFYSYFLRRSYQSNSQHILFAILISIFFIAVSLVRRYEFWYAFKDATYYSPAPELTVTATFLFTWVIVNLISKKHFVSAAILLFSYWFYAADYVVSNNWNINKLFPMFHSSGLTEIIFGHGYKWKLLFYNLFYLYPLGQYPLPLVSILFLEGGIVLLGILAASFILIIPKISKNKLIPSLTLLLLFPASFFYPVMRDPLSAIILAYCLVSFLPPQGNKKLIISTSVDKLFFKAGQFISVIFALYFAYLSSSAFYQIWKGPQFPDINTGFDIPAHLEDYLLASEDAMFYRHSGVDYARLMEVINETINSGQFVKGGSTISMQLAKVQYLSSEKTIARKIQQLILGVYLEATKSKKDILKEYLAVLPYSPDTRGLMQVSEVYFRKRPEDLDKKESLKIVMSIPNPIIYNPANKSDPFQSKNGRSIDMRAKEFQKFFRSVREKSG